MKTQTQKNFNSIKRIICIYLAFFSAMNLSGLNTKVKEKYKVNNDKLTFLFFGGGSSGASYTFNYLNLEVATHKV